MLRELVDIGKQPDKQIANLRFYFQNLPENFILHRVISEADDAAGLQLNAYKTNEEKIRNWTEEPLHK